MLSPTTLSFTVFALVLGQRPLRTGLWFFLGAFGATVIIGVVAAFVIGDAAASSNASETPPTWVAIIDVLAGALLLLYVVRALLQARRCLLTLRLLEGGDQLFSRVDAELGVHVSEVVFDGLGADEDRSGRVPRGLSLG